MPRMAIAAPTGPVIDSSESGLGAASVRAPAAAGAFPNPTGRAAVRYADRPDRATPCPHSRGSPSSDEHYAAYRSAPSAFHAGSRRRRARAQGGARLPAWCRIAEQRHPMARFLVPGRAGLLLAFVGRACAVCLVGGGGTRARVLCTGVSGRQRDCGRRRLTMREAVACGKLSSAAALDIVRPESTSAISACRSSGGVVRWRRCTGAGSGGAGYDAWWW